MQVHQQITQLRKDGQLDQAYALAQASFVAGEQHPLPLLSAYAWVIYALIKREADLLADDKRTEAQIHPKLEKWLREYSRLFANSYPDMVHSNLIRVVLKVSKNWSGFLTFAQWFGESRLDKGDFEGFKMDNGKTAMSIAEQYYTAIGAHLVKDHQHLNPAIIAWAESMLNKGTQLFPSSQFMPYRQAKWLMVKGDQDQALTLMTNVVKRMSRVSWTWASLACIWRDSNAEKAITCFSYACELARKEDEVAKVRVYLAQLLAQANRYEEASLQVYNALQYRIANQHRLPAELLALKQSEWFTNANQTQLASMKAKSVKQTALALVGIDETPKSTANQGEKLKITGELHQRDGQGFAFVIAKGHPSVFVSPNLLAKQDALVNGKQMSCWAVPSIDKQGKPSLKAVAWV
jgi:hypothetical protein